ncbi:hypothetical protein PHYSODRAFT_534114 [Phytophthora sojae]|uniref:Uncharacterized protein n=1 Tax=Phytophthora sojae (strain P6497) TaxID=1094619 RepID=G5AGD6_PHYSP|nr:hypothetical protein PHYSODRAFT_534114 [Phytophthora sojae]EGZ05376.1 hypothetical protein PHYSODRAFT_534114 [Phytophthora sojae]|eukprot:XP_009538907.1 hypothetical protein PHYSODRAFT_534114 [Phytophthora sojae]
MLQRERLRGRYRVTKVSIKMLYAVKFHSRPIDHFLSSEDAGDRTVVHDDTLWGGQEPAPAHVIRRADHLHRVLHVIQDAAAEWYPSAVVDVFRAVHGHALHHVPRPAPLQLLSAMCNLYQAVSSSLFEDIRHGNGAPVCVRYQVVKDCTFERCANRHVLCQLPPDVLRWVTSTHGPLKQGHPQRT